MRLVAVCPNRVRALPEVKDRIIGIWLRMMQASPFPKPKNLNSSEVLEQQVASNFRNPVGSGLHRVGEVAHAG